MTQFSKQPKKGVILIINGPSGAGKSSIQKEFQKQVGPLFLRIGIDSFFDALLPTPDLSDFHLTKKLEQKTALGEEIRSVTIEEDKEGFTVVPLKIGPAGDRVMRGMHRSIAAYAEEGNHIIVDYILYKEEYLDHLLSVLRGHRVYWIGVFAPLEEIEKREKQRGTSPVGHARSHYTSCHARVPYNLKLDVTEAGAEQLAKQIIAFLQEKQAI